MLTILADVIHEGVDGDSLAGLQLSVRARIDGRLGDLLVSVRRFNEHAPPHQSRAVRPLTKTELERARLAVIDRLPRGVRMPEIASLIGCSSSHFSRTFHATVGMTFKVYLLQSRIAAAMKLMSESDLSLCDVAGACGFSDQSSLSRAFTRRVGTTPFKWRSANRTRVPRAGH
ncbi:MAG TPA: AraC family transcriptional regulator [Candidatus Elarobacter sp.]|jgi:transcriptional regulator GlxA family with amidase domain|nr:AraC family transcriptional regulator [Candidatus Elarobacter sp.]